MIAASTADARASEVLTGGIRLSEVSCKPRDLGNDRGYRVAADRDCAGLRPGGVNRAPNNDTLEIKWGEMKNCGGSCL